MTHLLETTRVPTSDLYPDPKYLCDIVEGGLLTKISLGGFELSCVALGENTVCKRMCAHSASIYKFSRKVIQKHGEKTV